MVNADPLPQDTPPDGGGDDPDFGKDFGGLVPVMGVEWETPPSFNLYPTGGSGRGNPGTDVPDSGPISFDATAVRATENALLTQGRNAVGNYEALRRHVDSAVHGQFWGPKHAYTTPYVNPGVTPNPAGGWSPPLDSTEKEDQEALARFGEEFAGHINPAMQKALALQSNALELLGNYIAMINNAGQSYAHVDQASRFPDPTSKTPGPFGPGPVIPG
ncbi:hypothetical protein AB0N87_34895 [Streptomyces sp. NPDC093228]|uniref:hypothetical protein n=1 Tax=Streptomyces sp. NPDC093228 TaxID=3155070 RepID=UPI003426AEA8